MLTSNDEARILEISFPFCPDIPTKKSILLSVNRRKTLLVCSFLFVCIFFDDPAHFMVPHLGP